MTGKWNYNPWMERVRAPNSLYKLCPSFWLTPEPYMPGTYSKYLEEGQKIRSEIWAVVQETEFTIWASQINWPLKQSITILWRDVNKSCLYNTALIRSTIQSTWHMKTKKMCPSLKRKDSKLRPTLQNLGSTHGISSQDLKIDIMSMLSEGK